MGSARSRRRADRGAAASATLLALAALIAGCSGPAHSASPTPLATPAAPSPSPTRAPDGGAYVAIGDSLTFGIGAPDPLNQGYVARVADALAPAIDETRVFAVPGETATGFLERRLDDVLAGVATLGSRIELVTIGLGANEVLRARREAACLSDRAGAACRGLVDAAIDGAIQALDRIVADVQAALAAAGSDARVLVIGYYNPDPRPDADAAIAGADGIVACDATDAPGLDDRIACIAAERGIGLVDLHAAFRGRERELTRYAEGDVHPNPAGYQVIADTILAAVTADP